MRNLFIGLIILFIISCTDNSIIEINKIYSIGDISFTGIKIKGEFKTNFPESSEAKWGFLNGREVAIIRYPTVELAKTLGKIAGEEQTEFIEVVHKNIAHGEKVERIKCRGFRSNRYGFNNKLNLNFRNNEVLGDILILNKLKLFENQNNPIPVSKVCVVREPLYTDFIIHGNLVILGEPLMKDYGQGQMTESSEKTITFLRETAEKLPE
tara:strand:- start:3085 stop:3714 length:630 start_codon:yes stop_codon:yes gene_type:complete